MLATINPSSEGAARFKHNGGQSILCLDDDDCDTDKQEPDGTANTLTLEIEGTGTVGAVGIVVVNVRLFTPADLTAGFTARAVAFKQFEAATVLEGRDAQVPPCWPRSGDGSVGSTITIGVEDSSDKQRADIPVTVVATIGDINQATEEAVACAGLSTTCALLLLPRRRPSRTPTLMDPAGSFRATDPAMIKVFPRGVGGVATVLVSALNQTKTVAITFHGAATAATAKLSRPRISGDAGEATTELTDHRH